MMIILLLPLLLSSQVAPSKSEVEKWGKRACLLCGVLLLFGLLLALAALRSM